MAALVARAGRRAQWHPAITPDLVIPRGRPYLTNLYVIDKDSISAVLVLWRANPWPEGPGPIIATMAQTVGSFPIPVTIVYPAISDAEIDVLS